MQAREAAELKHLRVGEKEEVCCDACNAAGEYCGARL
jgi:hypothetical protein